MARRKRKPKPNGSPPKSSNGATRQDKGRATEKPKRARQFGRGDKPPRKLEKGS